MKNLQPEIYRQRLIMEGHYNLERIDGETLREYLKKLTQLLEMRPFAGPYSWPPDKWDNKEVELYGLNAFVAWTESGCHVYGFQKYNFFTSDVYSCKPFESKKVIEFTKKFWQSDNLVHEQI